jgi:hypothetical protein
LTYSLSKNCFRFEGQAAAKQFDNEKTGSKDCFRFEDPQQPSCSTTKRHEAKTASDVRIQVLQPQQVV